MSQVDKVCAEKTCLSHMCDTSVCDYRWYSLIHLKSVVFLNVALLSKRCHLIAL